MLYDSRFGWKKLSKMNTLSPKIYGYTSSSKTDVQEIPCQSLKRHPCPLDKDVFLVRSCVECQQLCLPRNCPLICHDPGQAEKCNYTTITISAMTKTQVKIPDRWFSNYQDISLEHLTTFITSHISSRCKYVTSHVSKY